MKPAPGTPEPAGENERPFYSQKYADIYFTQENPEAEKQFVFVAANRVSERLKDAETLTVAELGFGFGVNYALTQRAASEADAPRKLRYFSVEENFPGPRAVRALSERLELCKKQFDEFWFDGSHETRLKARPEHPMTRVPLANDGHIFVGDVIRFLEQADFQADIWYFDGFSPAKNAAMWSADVFALAFARTRTGGTFSTYSAAGWVKRNLEAAGFITEKVQGFGTKREMLTGYKP